MLRDEFQKIRPAHEGYLRRPQRFGGHFVRLTRENCDQSENFSRLRNPRNQRFSLARTDGELHFALAYHEHAAAILFFHEEYRALRISGIRLDGVEFLDRFRRQIAEEIRAARFAGLAAFADVKPVRSLHVSLPANRLM